MIDYTALAETFRSRFGNEARVFRAPGRVNLIGEHTDYNGGFVLPMAIDREVAVAITPRDDRRVRVWSVEYDAEVELDLDQTYVNQSTWSDLIEGMARILDESGTLKGADMVISSDVPTGAGLSSSAAVAVAVGLALTTISNIEVDRVAIAKAGQRTEHEYLGANVGIMDQFVSAHAQTGHALLLDCRSLEFENVPIDTERTAVVICDSNVQHELANSEYNTRRAECEEAVALLKNVLPEISQLRDVSLSEFEMHAANLPEPIRSRARHVISENERTLAAAEALKAGDMRTFGELMVKSHESLRDDYEVSCRELDVLVDAALELGALGSRMTGGGFGGSTVSLVRREEVPDFTAAIAARYREHTGKQTTIITSGACGGANEITG